MTIKLFISGQKGKFGEVKLSPCMLKVKELLDASQDGELFTTRQISELTGHRQNTLNHSGSQLPEYSYSASTNNKLWGKPATVAQLKRETEDDSGHRGRTATARKTGRGGEKASK